MPKIIKNKLKRKVISLETKIQILECLSNGEGPTAVGKKFNMSEATIRSIRQNQDAIKKSFISGTKWSVRISSHTRNNIREKMEKALVIWIEDHIQKRIPVDGTIIKHTALRMYKQISDMEGTNNKATTKDTSCFSASKGWLSRFMKRHGFQNLNKKIENVSKDEKAANEFPSLLTKTIENYGYISDQVFNAVEIGLFWKKLPNRTGLEKVMKTSNRSLKSSRDNVILFLCSNASGNRLIKPFILMNSALKFRSVKEDSLPMNFMVNKKTIMTEEIFTKWFNKYFIPEVKNYLNDNGIEFKVLLIIDHSIGFPNLNHPNVQLLFLPQNTSPLIQPLDQGIIILFRTYYIKLIFQYILDNLHYDNNQTIIDIWKNFTIMDCIRCASLALSKLTQSTLNACWRTIWPECVKAKRSIPDHTSLYSDIILLANSIGGEGFDNLTTNDIEELLMINSDDNKIDNEIIDVIVKNKGTNGDNKESLNDSLNVNVIKKGIQMANQLEDYFLKHDPNFKRVGQFQEDLLFCMGPYIELYKEMIKMNS